MTPLVSVNLVVRNDEKYIRPCLDAALNQSYKNLELTIFDNNSDARIKEIFRKEYPQFRLIESGENLYFGTGQNRCVKLTKGKYILALCVDVVLDKDFIKNAVEIMERDSRIGALQAKILQTENPKIIDTAGFEIYRSRRVVNRGHGEEDKGQYEKEEEIFSYEGACPFFRRAALEDSAVSVSSAGESGEYHDEDFVWYADDIDLGWRLRLFGWKSFYSPRVIAWHDRRTTKKLSGGYRDFIKMRRELPARKKMLDFKNLFLTFVKNDVCRNVFKDFFPLLKRQFMLFVYFLVFERYTLLAYPLIFLSLPKMLKKRRYIMKRKRASAGEMAKWFK